MMTLTTIVGYPETYSHITGLYFLFDVCFFRFFLGLETTIIKVVFFPVGYIKLPPPFIFPHLLNIAPPPLFCPIG